jgi:hypothetical protein
LYKCTLKTKLLDMQRTAKRIRDLWRYERRALYAGGILTAGATGFCKGVYDEVSKRSPDTSGEYVAREAVFCGVYHSVMWATGTAVYPLTAVYFGIRIWVDVSRSDEMEKKKKKTL